MMSSDWQSSSMSGSVAFFPLVDCSFAKSARKSGQLEFRMLSTNAKHSSSKCLFQLKSAEQVDARKLLEAWKQLFIKAPWDPTHQVLL